MLPYTSFAPLALVLALLLTACTPQKSLPPPSPSEGASSSQPAGRYDPDTPPALTVTAGETTLPVAMRQEHWDGTISCGEDLLVDLMQNHSTTELPVLAAGAEIAILFPADAQPDSVRLLTEPRAIDGRTLDSSPRMEELPLALAGGTGSFSLPAPPEGAQIHGFLLEAVWGEDNCWYAFAVLPAPEKATSRA